MGLKSGLAAVALAISCVSLAACSKLVEQPEMFSLTSEQAHDARLAVAKWVGAQGKTLFVCGAASGLGLTATEWDKGYQTDDMPDGRLVFIIDANGKPDVIIRDGSGIYNSAIDQGGNVVHMTAGGAESWLIVYSSGIIEVHNLTVADDKLVDLWTQNRSTSQVFATAKLFRASCSKA
jgi:hypothetical protein